MSSPAAPRLPTRSPVTKLAVTLGAGLLALVSSFSLSVTLLARPIEGVSGAFTNLSVAWSEILLAPVVVAWVVRLVLMRRRPHLGPAFVVIPVAVLVVVSWISVPWSIDPALALLSAMKLSLAVAVGALVANELGGDRLAVPLLLVVAIQSMIAIAQSATQHSLGLTALGEPHLALALPTASRLASADGELLLRAYGLAGNPNILGGVMALALILLRPGSHPKSADRAVRAIAWAVGSVALFLTFSRGGWAAWVVGTFVALAALWASGMRADARRWGIAIVAAALACLPLVAAFAPYLASRSTVLAPTPVEEQSINERFGLAGQALGIVRDRPIVGSGIGTLTLAFHQAYPDSPYRFHPAHVVGLTVAAETGVIGGLAFAAVTLAPWLALVRRRARWTRDVVVATAALSAIVIIGLVDHYPWGSSVGRIATWASLGLWVAAWRAAEPGRSPDAAVR
jgi:O-antigen ligase